MDAPTPKSAKTPPPATRSKGRSKGPKVTRRQILVGTGGGFALAIGYAVWPRDRPINFPVGEDETLINAWLKFGQDGRITVAVPQAEMGQGVYTALPQLLASELGADWRMVGVEPAPLHPVYANRAFVEGVGSGMPSLLAGIARWAALTVVERFELQATGGSTSVKAFWDPLRIAGAAARELFVAAAGRQFDVDPDRLDTKDGYVVGEGRRVSFAELLPLVDPDDLPEAPRLRETASLIGKPLPRLDIPAKVNGSAKFGADVRLPGMVYAAARSAPIGAGSARTFGPAAARQADGVVGVTKGDGWHAVTANTWWQARQALDLVDVEYDGGKLASSAELEKDMEAALGDAERGEAPLDTGDVDGALAAGTMLSARYAVPFLAHACLEPMTATVRIDGSRAEVWVPTQSQTVTAWKVASALDMPMADVTVYPTLLGGGFGRKVETGCAVQAALIAKDIGRPVQLVWHREEDTARDTFRPAVRAEVRGAVGADKKITALDVKVAAPNLGSSMGGRMMGDWANRGGSSASMVSGAIDLPYDIPNHRVSHADAATQIPLGYWRSVEHSYSPFFTETFIDELAERSGLDPLEFRLENMDRASRHARVLMLASSRGLLLAERDDAVGRGIAIHESFGSIVAQVAEVEAPSPDNIQVKRVTCVVDCGQVVNPDIVKAQMEGAIIFGLTAALYGRIDIENGEPMQQNFDGYPLLFMSEAPEIDVMIVPSTEPPGGVGEPGVPPIAPAVANAVYAATGTRLRQMPFMA